MDIPRRKWRSLGRLGRFVVWLTISLLG